jgi:predicted nuclease of predicted toxin-antitoxin system
MRILANENVPRQMVEALREEGHDVVWTLAEASTDEDILRRAVGEDRVVLTFDKDFGELAFRSGMPASTSVILLRISARDPSLLAGTIAQALAGRGDWAGHFSVIESDRVRMTALP